MIKRLFYGIGQRVKGYVSSLGRGDRLLRLVFVAVCESVTAAALIILLAKRDLTFVFTCCMTFLLVLAPVVAECASMLRMRRGLYAAVQLYMFFPLFGKCARLYFTTLWWDKLMHLLFGAALVLCGLCLLYRLLGEQKRGAAPVLFALCFSIALAALWEMTEFCLDMLFGLDMQMDSVIHGFSSGFFDSAPGLSGTVEGISEVIVNGSILPVGGYIDIGLIDSMLDLIVEAIGAIAASLWCIIDGGRRQPVLDMLAERGRSAAVSAQGRNESASVNL